MSVGTELKQQIWVRFADPEKEPVKEWCAANLERNAFDEKVLDYPATKVLAAENDKVVVYMPVQQTIMLESLGINPEATPTEIASGVLQCVKAAATQAYGAGFREIYFLATDDNTAEGAKKLGFEQVPFKVFRRRL